MTSAPIGDVREPFLLTLPPRPYPGLRPFEKHEWPIFFGRERMADAVVADVLDKGLLVVHGDSGCGKSSLVRAAMLPRLEQEHARGGIEWRTCWTTPGESPVWNLSRDLAARRQGHPDDELALEIRRVLNFGPSAPGALAELLGVGGTHPICLLIDQFEELFAHAQRHGPEDARLLTRFCNAIHARRVDGLYLVLTMRSEFLGTCARFDGFAETVNATQYLLPRMQHGDLLRAMREPAALFDGEVTRELAERLISDAGGGQDQLPLIQHGLMLLHRDHVGAPGRWRLGVEHYDGRRGLKGLLSDHADAVMEEAKQRCGLSKGSARLVEDLFRALTDINAEGQAIRRPRTLAQLSSSTGADSSLVRCTVDTFRAEGVSLLRPYGDRPIDPKENIDISHEALIRCWERVADPQDGWLIREFRSGLVWRALLVQADSYEREPANLLAPTMTDERETWLHRRTAAWAERYGGGWDRVKQLIQASVAARDRQRAAESAARTKERLFTLGLAVSLVIAVVGATIAAYSWARAARNAEEASAQAKRADNNAELAEERRAALQKALATISDPAARRILSEQLQPNAARQLSDEEIRTKLEAEKLRATEGTKATARADAGGLKLWINGSTLRVRFLDGEPKLQERVVRVAREWAEHANVQFTPIAAPDAEIRVSFKDSGVWSFVGTDALGVATNSQTVNLGWLTVDTEEREFRRAVLHEFGHVLGLVHEYQNPNADIPWDRAAVFKLMTGPPNFWDPHAVEVNLFNKMSIPSTSYRPYDPESIMMLGAFDQSYFTRPFTIKQNYELSSSDKAFIAKLYPR